MKCEFATFIERINISSDSDLIPKVEFEDIKSGMGYLNKDISRKFDDRKGTLFQPKDILFGKLRPYLKNWLFPDFTGVALGDFWVFRALNSNPEFAYVLIQSPKFQAIANDTAGTKMPRCLKNSPILVCSLMLGIQNSELDTIFQSDLGIFVPAVSLAIAWNLGD